MDEGDFVAEVVRRSGCGLMLDVNNAYVNATNFGFDVDAWMRTAPLDRVVQMHIAGHDWFSETSWEMGDPPRDASEREGRLIVDTHGSTVCDDVLALLERTLEKTGPVPVLLERDQAIPPLEQLLAEVAQIKAIWTRVTKRAA
jgi:uncharacterized protein (UPF0276 family)